MTRRKFMRIAGSAVALAGLPMAARMGRAETAAAASTGKFGGLTPNADFYVTSYGGTPMVDVASWRLKIHGLVDKPLTLSMSDITRLPPMKQALTLECIGNRPNGSL